MPTAAAIVDAQIAAYVAGDIEAFCARYADDAICVRLPTSHVIAHGKAEIEAVWGSLFAAREGAIHFELASRMELGAFVTDHERVVRKDGRSFEAIAIYEVRDGLIARVWLIEPPPST